MDNDIVKRILDIQKLNDDDKKQITTTIDALLRDAKTRKLTRINNILKELINLSITRPCTQHAGLS